MKKCYICNQEINPKDSNHIFRCARNNYINDIKEVIKYNQICFELSKYFDYDFMNNYYNVKGYSLPDFKKEFGLTYKQTQFLLDFFKIEKRNISQSCYIDRKINKQKSILLEKYGVDNVSKSELIKEKKRSTFIKNYGVDNIWKSKEYYFWLHSFMEEKYGKKSLPNKYGNMQKWWDNQTVEYKQNHMKPANKGFKYFWNNLNDELKNEIIQKRSREIIKYFDSKLETRIAVLLDILQISYQRQFWIKRKSYDFKIHNTNVIIEVQGDFWHANPEIYKDDDLLNFGDRIWKASELWYNDLIKKNDAESIGYKVIYFWEQEINELNDFQLMKLVEFKLYECGKNKENF